MGKLPSLCPYCRQVVKPGKRCGCRQRERNPVKQSDRLAKEPWRTGYTEADYRRNRQLALDTTGGRCAECGKVIAVKRDGRWAMVDGDVNHDIPLSEGGDHSLTNLRPLCKACHVIYDTMRRKRSSNR